MKVLVSNRHGKKPRAKERKGTPANGHGGIKRESVQHERIGKKNEHQHNTCVTFDRSKKQLCGKKDFN